MAKERLFNLPETKGSFIITGNTSGTVKESFSKSGKTKKDVPYLASNFGVEYDENKQVYLDLYAQQPTEVYLTKKTDELNEKGKNKYVTKKVPYNDARYDLVKDQYQPVNSIRLGLEKDEKGKNVVKNLFSYDAIEYVQENLIDGLSVFIRGAIEYSSYEQNGNVERQTKFVPAQVSLLSEEITFPTQEGKETKHNFTQQIVFKGINKEVDGANKQTGRFILEAYIIGYSTVELAEFVVDNSQLANTFRNKLKPYHSLEVWGDIVCSEQVEQVKDTNTWGAENTMVKLRTPYKRELVITGANGGEIDTSTYTEKNIEEALVAIKQSKTAVKEFEGKKEDSQWGSTAISDDDWDDGEWN